MRGAIPLCLLAASLVTVAAPAAPLHGIALHGEPRYPAGFEHFDYVNPEAPVGGTLRLASIGNFDSFNWFIPKGNVGAGDASETLMVSSADEPFSEYGLIAESIEVPPDRSWVEFTLRKEARWHDGEPITVEDVIFSLDILKSKGEPRFRFYYAPVASAEKTGERTVRFNFSETGNRELPLIVGQLPILAKHWWADRDFEKTTLEPPLGSGPYRISGFEAGRHIVVERVADYWGADLPVNRGRNNFDRIRYDYYRDVTVVREALKSGDIDYREENQAKAWALDYDVAAVRDGLLIKEQVVHQRPAGMQAFVMNSRRATFADRRVRRALAYAFDFDWTNRNLFFSQYTRTDSFFENSELAAQGLPSGEELEILERYRDTLPPEVFEQPYTVPVTSGDGWPRDNLREAFALLAEAGWVVRDLQLVNESTGEPMRFEILLISPEFERIVLPFVRNLKRLGIDARVRLVDQSQYINRLRSFDYDMFVFVWGQADSPGNEQRGFWSCEAADAPGARNFARICDPVIDDLIELVVQANDRESLVARVRALDRVLLWGHYVIPNWHARVQRLLWWDKFSRPAVTPRTGTSIDLWWYDEAKAAALAIRLGSSEAEQDGRGGAGTPPAWVIALVAIALAALGYHVLRRALRR